MSKTIPARLSSDCVLLTTLTSSLVWPRPRGYGKPKNVGSAAAVRPSTGRVRPMGGTFFGGSDQPAVFIHA